MLAERYAQAARDLVDKLQATQMESIRRAGQAIAQSLANRGAFWLHHIGHGGQLELHHRAGGLMAAQILSLSFEVSSPTADLHKSRPGGKPVEADLETVRLAVRSSDMRAGDVLMLASVSGRSRLPIELALAAREMGITVIAITSLEYTARVDSLHPSGKKLCEVADILIDNCAPFGDACIDLQGYDHKALPISGLAHALIGWMVCAEVIERMQAMGKPPHIHQSVNRPGGQEYNEQALKEYHRLGY